ncbi:hypothetical protein ACU60T_25115 [Klebsiella aerogenes]
MQLKARNVRVDNYFSEEDKTSDCVDLGTIPGADEKVDLAQQLLI